MDAVLTTLGGGGGGGGVSGGGGVAEADDWLGWKSSPSGRSPRASPRGDRDLRGDLGAEMDM